MSICSGVKALFSSVKCRGLNGGLSCRAYSVLAPLLVLSYVAYKFLAVAWHANGRWSFLWCLGVFGRDSFRSFVIATGIDFVVIVIVAVSVKIGSGECFSATK